MEMQLLKTTSGWEQDVGEQARRLRQRRRLTQAELASRANISLSALKNLEAGKGSTLGTLIGVARALDRTDWLSSFAPPDPAVSPMAVLRERRRTAKEPQRIRHPAPRGET